MNWKAGFLVAIWFLVGVILFSVFKDWQVVAAIATWLLAGGITFAIVQVQQARRSTNAQLAVEFFQRLKDEKDTLRRIYELGPEDIKLISKNSDWGVDNLNRNKIS